MAAAKPRRWSSRDMAAAAFSVNGGAVLAQPVPALDRAADAVLAGDFEEAGLHEQGDVPVDRHLRYLGHPVAQSLRW